MKLFLWYYLCQVSDHYHPGGGLVIIAESLEKAEKLAKEKGYIEIDCPPDKVFTLLEAAEEEVIVFPDAGCC